VRGDYPVAEWVETFRPAVEARFGPLPEFDIRVVDEVPLAQMSWEPWTVYWPRDPLIGRPLFVYSPENIANLQIEQYTRGQPAYFVYALVHDITHLYQTDFSRGMWHRPKQFYEYTHWVEGGADLAACAVIFETREWLRALQKISADLLGRKVGRRAVDRTVAVRMGGILVVLAQRGILQASSISEFPLPFDIPAAFARKVNRAADDHLAHRDASLPIRSDRMPYILGFSRLARVVRSGRMTIEEAFCTPIANRDLLALARECGEPFPA